MKKIKEEDPEAIVEVVADKGYEAVIVKIVVSKSCFLLVTCFIWVGRCYPEIRPAVNTKTSCCASIDSWSYLRVSDTQAR